ncbi:MAG: hypothetical protein QOH36_1218 [Actinomycetota bacterium]|jgi:hypothetical protein|nr:hypothetical protein [Actinomycetota bacterium]MEA2971948.1 hypothetical protein [Actinomycetota bacterium]
MDFKKLTQGEKIVLIAGVLLIIDLLFFAWHKVETVVFGQTISGTASAIESPNGFYGVLALLLAIVMVGVVVATKLAGVKLPDLPIPWGQVHMIAGIAILALLLIKLLAETDFLGFGAYLGLLLGAAMAFGGFSINKESSTRTF